MFGRKQSSPSSTAVNNRLRRAQQLRQQRMKNKGTAGVFGDNNSADEEDTLVISGISTIICALLIIAAGAGFAALFFYIFQPGCVQDIANSLSSTVVVKKDGSGGSRRLDIDSNDIVDMSSSVPSNTSSTSVFPTTAKFPPQCTVEQMKILEKQLPAGGCYANKDKPFRRMDCSFSAATNCGDYPYWLYEFHAQNDVIANDESADKFIAVIVGCNKAYSAIELLQIATRDTTNTKYDIKVWKEEYRKTTNEQSPVEDKPSTCPRKTADIPSDKAKQKAQIYCIEGMPTTFQQLQKTKIARGLTDHELHLTHLVVTSDPGLLPVSISEPIGTSHVGIQSWKQSCSKHPNQCQEVETDKMDRWIQSKPDLMIKYENDNKTKPLPPIHYMSVAVEGNDYEVLQGSARNLHRVQYLDLTYHWYGDWSKSKRSLKDLIYRLKKKGFVCYWPGNNENMWRITDCWQDHYELQYFANIACVNTNMEAVLPLAERMEEMFLQTLKKVNIQYGKE